MRVVFSIVGVATAIGLCILLVSCGGANASDHYQAGTVAAQNGDWQKAREEFDAAGNYNDATQRAADAQQKSATVTNAYSKAKDAIQNEKWYEAYSQLQTLIALSPNYQDSAKLLADVTGKLDEIYDAAAKAQENGDFATSIDKFTAAGGYKDSASRLSAVSSLQSDLANLYGSMKQYESDKDFAKAAATAASILKKVTEYKDVKTLLVGYKEQLYAQSSDYLAQNKGKQALVGFQALGAIDPAFKDVQEKIGQVQTRLKTPQPGTYPFNLTQSTYNLAVTVTSVEVLSDGTMRINERVRNNGTSADEIFVLSDGSVINIVDADGNRYVPTSWGTEQGPRQLNESALLPISVGQEVMIYITFPPLKDASKTFTFNGTRALKFDNLSILS